MWWREVNTRAIIVIVLAKSKVNISTKQTEESVADKISKAGVTLVKLDQDKDFLVLVST